MSEAPAVYIVEDDSSVAKSMMIMLELTGFAPILFETADDLLSQIGQVAPGCLVIDLNLPGTDGLSALRELRRRGVTWPVLMMTGARAGEIEGEAIGLGASAVLEKPFSTELFLAEVRRALGAAILAV
ncbi:response regulator transcription factor [Sphingosinicella sp. BN140058]|uniref:response regulator transcription factor n=1 Tax=Sphingosinicella sp. BN140058 TaxID=1892855 RepID=UPI0013EE0D4A|nr:response regulator [Sphingosinicella sp. BN140058]